MISFDSDKISSIFSASNYTKLVLVYACGLRFPLAHYCRSGTVLGSLSSTAMSYSGILSERYTKILAKITLCDGLVEIYKQNHAIIAGVMQSVTKETRLWRERLSDHAVGPYGVGPQ